MANHLSGEVAIATSSGTLTFRLGVNELIEVQGDFGLVDNDDEFATALQNLSGFKRHRDMVFRGLQRHHPSITLQEAGDLMNELGMDRVKEVIATALGLAFPEPKQDGEPRPFAGPTSS
jgi:hypothetical protein